MSTRIKAAAVVSVVIALTGCSMAGSSLPHVVRPPARHTSVLGATALRTSPDRATNPMLREHIEYQGGGVQRVPKIYVNYWGFNVSGRDPDGEQFYLTNFLEGVGGSSWWSDLTQYYELRAGRRVHVQNNVGEFQGAWVDQTSVPLHPTDRQIQAAAKRLITHFRFDADATYIVATPHGRSTQGFGTQFCTYHGALLGSGGPVAYVDFPYMPDAGAPCFANAVNGGSAGRLDGVSILGGGVLSEAQTDPFVGFNYAWINPDGSEVASDCTGLNLRDITFSTGTFAIQGLWSDKRDVCSDSGP